MAYPFWARVKRECARQGIGIAELEERTKRLPGDQRVTKQTIYNIESMARPPKASVVNAIAAALDIDQDEAHQLAGVVPDDGTTVRVTIEQSTRFSDEQRQALLDLVAKFEAERR